jgi:hypothetical protein
MAISPKRARRRRRRLPDRRSLARDWHSSSPQPSRWRPPPLTKHCHANERTAFRLQLGPRRRCHRSPSAATPTNERRSASSSPSATLLPLTKHRHASERTAFRLHLAPRYRCHRSPSTATPANERRSASTSPLGNATTPHQAPPRQRANGLPPPARPSTTLPPLTKYGPPTITRWLDAQQHHLSRRPIRLTKST